MDVEEYSEALKFFYVDEITDLLVKYINESDWHSLLDLGCGDGNILYFLNKRGFFKNGKSIFAVDLSKNRIDLVKKINHKFKCYVNDACDVTNISDNSIDFLISTQVIEHVPDDAKMVKEISRVLKKGGTVYLSTVFKKRYAWYYYRCNGKWTLDPTHLREYTEETQLLDLFGKDFDILENKKTVFKFPLSDFVFRRMKCNRDIYKSKVSKFFRNFRVPILGYYCWELVLRKR